MEGEQGEKQTPRPARVQSVHELKRLIQGAALGEKSQIEKLLAPFISDDERLIDCGVSAKFGLFPTYDFFFLTDRRVGDLEITPLTGALNVEIVYLHKVDALVLIQPAFPLIYRLIFFVLYCALIGFLVNPILMRAYLRFKKSGILIKLAGHNVAALIFADRGKFSMMTKLSRQISEIKRTLDKEAI